MKKAIVIGSGFAGLSAATYLADAGVDVTLLEQHSIAGGRARFFEEQGFIFEMGPSWYWMPDVFENYFAAFGKKPSDYYRLSRLDPSYRIYWDEGFTDIPADYEKLKSVLENIETGAAKNLDKFMAEAKYKYDVGMNKLVLKPGQSATEFIDMDIAKGVVKLDVFTDMKKHLRKFFRHPDILRILEFPVLFLGALPQNIPALYSLMNYADIQLGTWYPQGGMYKVIEAMQSLAEEKGVKFFFNAKVKKINIQAKKVTGVIVDVNGVESVMNADLVVSGADYHFTETTLIDMQYQSYSTSYWNSRVMAPSCLLYFVGLNKKLKNINHHSLFFDVDFDKHGREIYETMRWPEEPLFYVCAPSVTDQSVAPPGHENLFFLVPIAAGLSGDTEELKERYFKKLIARYESHTGEAIADHIVFKTSYAISDFKKDYGAFKGNAYGLANTLLQTAILKPSLRSKTIKNLYYTGQLTVPGPGVPPSLISGQVVANVIKKDFKI